MMLLIETVMEEKVEVFYDDLIMMSVSLKIVIYFFIWSRI